MALNSTGSRNTPNSTPKLSERTVEVMHKYQEVGRDIELLREHLRSPYEKDGVDIRIAACLLSVSQLNQELARMQIAALNEARCAT